MGPSLLRAPELRVTAAAMVAAISLGLAILEVAAARTDLLMLDFREWRPVGSGSDAPAFFESLQRATVPSDLRPLQIELRLAKPGEPTSFLAAERLFEVDEDGCYRFHVYLWSPSPVDSARVLAYVNGAVAWSAPLSADGRGVSLAGLRPLRGTLGIRLELRSEPHRAVPGSPSPSVRFQYAVLRRSPCGHQEVRAGA